MFPHSLQTEPLLTHTFSTYVVFTSIILISETSNKRKLSTFRRLKNYFTNPDPWTPDSKKKVEVYVKATSST